MSKERDTMVASLKEIFVPALRESGFKGSFPHFRRTEGSELHLLMFVFSRWGGAFYIEISKCSSAGYINIYGETEDVTKLKVHSINHDVIGLRPRIGLKFNETFNFTEYNTNEVAQQVLGCLGEAEEWWRIYPQWWKHTGEL